MKAGAQEEEQVEVTEAILTEEAESIAQELEATPETEDESQELSALVAKVRRAPTGGNFADLGKFSRILYDWDDLRPLAVRLENVWLGYNAMSRARKKDKPAPLATRPVKRPSVATSAPGGIPPLTEAEKASLRAAVGGNGATPAPVAPPAPTPGRPTTNAASRAETPGQTLSLAERNSIRAAVGGKPLAVEDQAGRGEKPTTAARQTPARPASTQSVLSEEEKQNIRAAVGNGARSGASGGIYRPTGDVAVRD